MDIYSGVQIPAVFGMAGWASPNPVPKPQIITADCGGEMPPKSLKTLYSGFSLNCG
ncbi:MAG: hypothetical protein LBU32_18845 [Clostridiales bacterium]|jgi:hypothetical protein|nr:hypothetical protein [Clostridiales bacterium]